jgi:phage FluMu gp28-like protein
MTPEEIAQNIDGKQVAPISAFFNPKTVDAMFVDDLPELKTAENGHIYAQGVDPALTYDECWSIVLDVTDPDHWKGVECGYLRGRKTTDDILELMISQYNAFEQNRSGLKSNCSLALDATGMGGKMIRERLNDAGVAEIRNIEFGGRTQTKGKRKVMADLRMTIDSGRLRLPRTGPWLGLRKHLGYRVDITKPKDDGIMALGCAIQQGLRHGGETLDANSVPFDARIAQGGRYIRHGNSLLSR